MTGKEKPLSKAYGITSEDLDDYTWHDEYEAARAGILNDSASPTVNAQKLLDQLGRPW